MNTEQPAATADSVMDRLAAKFDEPSTDAPTQYDGGPMNAEEPEEKPDEAQAQPEDTGESEVEEIEFDGAKFAVPKGEAQKVKDALLRTADYTRKTQETAEKARLIEAREQQAQIAQAFQQQHSDKIAALQNAKAQLKSLDSLTLNELDTEQATRVLLERSRLQNQVGSLTEELTAAQAQFSQQIEQAKQQALQAVVQRLQRTIGWNPSVDAELQQYAQSAGVSPDKALNLVLAEPAVAEWAWKAAQYDKAQANKAAALKQTAKAPPVVKPGSSNPMPQDVKDKLNFRKQMNSAKSSSEKARLIEQKLSRFY